MEGRRPSKILYSYCPSGSILVSHMSARLHGYSSSIQPTHKDLLDIHPGCLGAVWSDDASCTCCVIRQLGGAGVQPTEINHPAETARPGTGDRQGWPSGLAAEKQEAFHLLAPASTRTVTHVSHPKKKNLLTGSLHTSKQSRSYIFNIA